MKRYSLILVTMLVSWGFLGDVATAGKNLKFDVAENGFKFSPDEAPVDGSGVPLYGNTFITQGYIYPAGTLDPVAGDDGCGGGVVGDGVCADGSPEFPDLVIGIWTCFGSHVGDGGNTVMGPWVNTTQTWDIGATPGETTIITTGFEQPNPDPIYRAITGGTGRYLNAKGQHKQTTHEELFNETVGVMFTTEFNVH